MATPFTAEQVQQLVTDDNDDVVEHFEFGSDDELEFNSYEE